MRVFLPTKKKVSHLMMNMKMLK